MRFVQLQHPVTKQYTKIDRQNGRIVGHKKTPYKGVPILTTRMSPT